MPKNSVFLLLVKILALCISYAILGRLALMLAIPPGYATAIFPSAGIAVAALLIWGYRLWPGVFLGSVLLNIGISLEHVSFSFDVLGIAVSAATGATLQALAGALLVHRYVGFPTTLSKEYDIFCFMIMAGPVACIINASFGVTSLYATGSIALSDYLYSWFTWWVGDTIGVLITTPLMFIAFVRPRTLWWGRRNVVALPLLLMLTGVVALFVWASQWELERTQFDLKDASRDAHEKLRASFASYLDSVAYIERLFSSSSRVTRDEFRAFVEYALANKPGIKGLSWNPAVLKHQRDKFEDAVRKEGFPGFQITERNKEGQLVRAEPRDNYFAVNYIEPLKGNEKAFGFDLASTPERRKALHLAIDSGQAVATERITLIQESTEKAGFLLIQPVYAGLRNTVEARRRNLKGFVVGAFRVSDIVDTVLRDRDRNEIVVAIYENSAAKSTPLYGAGDSDASFIFTDQLDIGGRRWIVNYWPSPDYLAKHRGWQAWAVLAGGLLFISILGAFLLAMTGRAYQIKTLVARRTAELSGILSTAVEAIITIDVSGKIETINPAGEALFGYSASEITGKPIVAIIPDFFIGSGIDVNKNTQAFVTESRRDSDGVRKNNTIVPIELAISTLSIPDKTLYTAIIHDLTERSKINRMKDEFISTVSHELRTPLTSIKGALGLIVGGVLDSEPEKTKSMLAISYNNCERLERLINDLLEINKNQSPEIQLQLSSICINTLVDRAILSNQGYADKYGVAYAWSSPEEKPIYVNADENKLIQVLSNLLSNAVKYSPKGAQVLISISHRMNDVRVSISDTGPGIPLDFQDRVFEKFTQADSSDTRRAGGTGLGMAIAKSQIEKQGGRIGFTSKPGHGTTFYIDLPIIQVHGAECNEARTDE